MTDSPLHATEAAPVQPSSAAADSGDHIARRNRLVINLLLVATFVVILNETIMGVAIPHLVVDLGITEVAAQWLSTAFMLTMAVVIPITGFLLQRFNTRPIFIAAMSLFSAGTLIAALAPGFEVLLAARVVQASGTAIMMPLLMTTVMTLVPPATRGRTMGNISIVISVAPAIGPTISGIILSTLSWRWMFILVLPIAVGALILGAVRVKNVTEPRVVPIDVFSIILSAFGFGGLVYGLSNIGGASATFLGSWMPLIVGLVALAAFVLRQLALQRTDRALLDLRTFKARTFTVAILLMAVSMMALFGTIIVLPFFMQNVLQLDALTTGLLLLPGGLVMGVLAPFVGRLYDRFGPTVLLVPGSIIVSGVLWGLTMVNENTSMWWVLVAHVTLSIGLALMFTPLFTAGLGALKPQLYSHGSAIVGTVQQLAGASGTALFIAVMSGVALTHQSAGESVISSTAAGIQAAFLCGAIISLLGVVAAFFVRRPRELTPEQQRLLEEESGGAAEGVPIGH
ncbi:MDR family MFS transporter [Herbiconiux ginsengi]|uniref:MFS transporter, DHA2 family, lincomycin resistance protein n=1 Tax=Herbiconiux ginsengi TaxID=381665 RepID=A0A1H3T254_9MICO|nr:MDR family MFS transporter [Herbiconiux ginsengi]SDZ43419.1 MFS transporter, DHA2 family, lincomycin resistance protein [Herbiconiux ginsengi]